MASYSIRRFPRSRIATIDVCEIGQRKHHIAGMIEIDVTDARKKIRKYKQEVGRISFTAWLIKVISVTVKEYDSTAAYLKGKRSIVVFDDINVSIVVEKKIDGQKVPMPLIINKANERSIESITKQITDAQNEVLTEGVVVLEGESTRMERLYYFFPGFMRRLTWRLMLKNPKFIFGKMGNVAITSVGMMGSVNGWFIPKSIHPLCVGLSSVIKKPIVVDDSIVIREMLNMTILIDHDVIDGAPMARFINDLSKNIRNGLCL
jgi:pyruvate/2-oxoglutarate dehydrogenase complex dihydrolipoamide acyltransferase (E2) component